VINLRGGDGPHHLRSVLVQRLVHLSRPDVSDPHDRHHVHDRVRFPDPAASCDIYLEKAGGEMISIETESAPCDWSPLKVDGCRRL